MTQDNEPFTGTHALVNLIDCKIDWDTLNANKIKRLIEDICRNYKLSVLGGYYHDFDNKGALTGVCVLAESHISVHTWPELNYVTADIFLCNYSKDNSDKVYKILNDINNIFMPITVNKKIIMR